MTSGAPPPLTVTKKVFCFKVVGEVIQCSYKRLSSLDAILFERRVILVQSDARRAHLTSVLYLQEYTKRQVTALIGCMNHVGKRARLRLVGLLEEEGRR